MHTYSALQLHFPSAQNLKPGPGNKNTISHIVLVRYRRIIYHNYRLISAHTMVQSVSENKQLQDYRPSLANSDFRRTQTGKLSDTGAITLFVCLEKYIKKE